MAPRREPVPRARSPWHWLGGLLVLGVVGAGLVAAALLLWENVDIRRLSRNAGTPEGTLPAALPPAAAAHPATGFRVALFRSAASARFFPDPEHYSGLVEHWERLAAESGGETLAVGSAEQIEGLEPGDLLLAPAAVCLRPPEVEAMRRHAERGGGLLLTWAVGARDGACEWVGWDALRRLTGAPEVRELGRRRAVYLTVPGGLPLSVGLDPATRIELRPEDQLALTAGGLRAFWSDWAMNPDPAGEDDASDAAAWLRVTDGGGRVVWFGFTAFQGASPADQERIGRLHRSGLLWAGGVPTAEILPWPGADRAALLVAQDVEAQFANAASLASLARSRGFPVTFFVLSRMALDFPELADSLRAAGEIGSQTSDHDVVAGVPYRDQLTRLRRSWSEIRGWAEDSARGLRPPEERFDENTLRSWRALGGTYLVAQNGARGGSPEVFETAEGRIALLPRIIEDDYNVIVQQARMRSRELREAFLRGTEKVHALGGLAVLSLHSQVGGTPGRVGVVGEVVDSLRAQGGWWVAPGREIAGWWLARRESTVTARETETGLELRVTAPPSLPLAGAWLGVTLPPSRKGWAPQREGESVRYRETSWGVAVPLDDVPAGESRTVVLRPPAEEEPTP